MLLFKIVDTGKGFRKQDAPKLFQMFGKLKRTASMNSEGIGMGLMICKQLVELNQGVIELTSEGVNKGATVFFTFKAWLDNPNQSSSSSREVLGGEVLLERRANKALQRSGDVNMTHLQDSIEGLPPISKPVQNMSKLGCDIELSDFSSQQLLAG